MLEESGKMIADSASRLGGAVQELRDLLVSPSSTSYSLVSRLAMASGDARIQITAERVPELSQDEEVLKAQEAMEEVSV